MGMRSSQALLRRQRSRGVALFVSLVLLLMLTIVGVSAVQTTTLEVRMARNEHDSMLAFQAAELALRDGEAVLEALTPVDRFVSSGAGGLWTVADMGDPDRWALPGVWGVGSGHSVAAPTPVASVSSQPQPRFMIEYLTTLTQEVDGYAVDGPDVPLGSEPIEVFRITARGVGATENAVVVLQSTYARGIPSPSEDVGLFADARAGRLSWRELDGAY